MQKFRSLLLMMSCLAASPALAEEFYVELGRANSEAEVREAWVSLRDANPKVLGKYDVYPNQIIQPDGSFTYRLQAGPMADKNEAQRVCRRLFRKQVSCFLIEGFDPKNEKTFSGDAKKTPSRFGIEDFLPWGSGDKEKPAMIAAADVPPPPVKEEKKNWAKHKEEPAKEEEKPKEAAPAKDAKVDVAEAIPVPVTTDNNEVSVGEATPVFSFDNMFSSAPDAAANGSASSGPGWLSVQPFLNEESAKAFWKNLKKRKLEDSKDLTMQVIHPLVSHDIPKVILALGSFPSEQAAMKYCNDYIASSRYLECSFSGQPPEGEDPANIARNDSHSPAADEYSLFWVDVLSESSQDKALERWERIRTDNDDLLSDVRSQITASMAKPGQYMVRVGPLKMKSRANKLCDALKARKIECTVSSL